MKTVLASLLFALLPVTTAYAVSPSQEAIAIDIAAKHIATAQERQQLIADATAPIKSPEQLSRYLREMPPSYSPLSKLSPGAQQRFLRSLRFNESGLTSYLYKELTLELSPTEIYQVLSLFGAQNTSPIYSSAKPRTPADATLSTDDELPSEGVDYIDFLCSARATCTRSDGSICKSNC